ncbi:MAG: DUF1844 domain-containing protein [Deltaproteobacteria bacterium]|nr:DUF1844 domain-containing protein [Deltaproteobacteria bacterium]
MTDERKEEKEKKSSFKVVDRRRFTDDGDERSGPDVPTDDRVRVDPKVDAKAAAAPAGAPPKQNGSSSSEGPAAKAAPAPAAGPADGLTFSMFLQSLAQQALMQMGLIPWPHGQRELALEQARDTIDIVGLLKDKTKGNLDAAEQQLMDTVVYELKVSFVEVQQAIARSRAGVKAPPPPGMPR